MVALLITLFVYLIPTVTTGFFWYVQMGLSSVFYIILIYHFAKIRERLYLIVVEFISLLCLLLSLYNNFISDNLVYIINSAFILELMICIGGLALGVNRRDTSIRNSSDDNHRHNRIGLLFSEGVL